MIVGQLGQLDEPSTVPLLLGRRRVAGSPIGGIAETQEPARLLRPQEHPARVRDDDAFKRMERADVRYRFVIDMASLKA